MDMMRGVYATDVALKLYNEMNKNVRWQGCRRFGYENVGEIDIANNLTSKCSIAVSPRQGYTSGDVRVWSRKCRNHVEVLSAGF